MADDLHELSALYALDALTDDDRLAYEAHLESCPRCREELVGLQASAAELAYAPEGPVPPSALRERIVAAARAEPQNVVGLGAYRRHRVATVAAAVVAVAACAAAVGFGLWASSLHGSLQRTRKVEAVLADPHARHVALTGGAGQLVVASSGDAALTTTLSRPPAGKTYEAWVAPTGSASSARPAGLFSGGTTLLRVRVPAGAAVMVTLERAAGAARPTHTPLLVARA